MSTFVSIGNANQAFARLLDVIIDCADLLPKPIIVQHGHTPFSHPLCEAYSFLDMEQFVDHVRNAEVVIVHAGAGSVLHAIRAGKRPIVMPRRIEFGEHVDDHQLEFARELADAGRVTVVESVNALREAIAAGSFLQGRGDGAVAPALIHRIAEILADCASERGG